MANTHKGVTGRRRPTNKVNEAKRVRQTEQVREFLFNGLDDLKKKAANKTATK